MDELRANIRRSETSKAKYEARLECLRVSGAPVDEWLKEVDLLAVQDTLPRSSSLLSVRTDASGAAVSKNEIADRQCVIRLECLCLSGAPVEEWLKKVYLLAKLDPLLI